MSSKHVHRIRAADPAASQSVSALLAELQGVFIRAKTPVGAAVSSVVSTWRQDKDGSFIIELSPLAATRLPALSGLALLQAARDLAAESAPPLPVLAEPALLELTLAEPARLEPALHEVAAC